MEIGFAVIVVLVVILAIWVLIEMKRMKHKFFAIFLILLIIFIYVTGAIVFSGKGIDYKSFSGLKEAGKIYFVWLGGFFDNVKTITANAIKMDWTLNSQQNISKTK